MNLVATTAMTIFSALVSFFAKKEYREPRLLTEVWNHLPTGKGGGQSIIFGWIAHYIIGLAFAIALYFIWDSAIFDANVVSAVLLGIVAGIIGAIGWKVLLNLSSLKNKEYDVWYYIQLVCAHVVFSGAALLMYNQFAI
jgi:hypothetical protein